MARKRFIIIAVMKPSLISRKFVAVCISLQMVLCLGIYAAKAQGPIHEADLEPTLSRLWQQHHIAQAVSLCRKIREQKPTKQNERARVLAHKILGSYNHGKDEKQSIANFDEAIRLKPDDADLYYSRGVVKFENGDSQNSVADFQKAIKIDPTRGYFYRMLASAYSSLGENVKAIDNFTLALARLPRTHEFYPLCLYFRAQTYEKMQKYDKAIADYSDLIKLHKDSDDGYIHRASCYIKLHKYDNALQDYAALAQKDPSNDDVIRARADVLVLKGDNAAALESYTQAIKLQPSSSNFRARGRAYEKIGRHDLAEQDIKKARDR